MKQEEAKKLYMYTSVAVQTVKDGKDDKESLAKLNQVIIDGILSNENNRIMTSVELSFSFEFRVKCFLYDRNIIVFW